MARIYLDEFLERFSNPKNISKKEIKQLQQDKFLRIYLNDEIANAPFYKTELLSEEETDRFIAAVENLRAYGIQPYFDKGFTPEEAIDASNKMNSWVNEIQNARVDGQELSPFEKYMYAFDIATQFQYNMEDKSWQDPALSRNLIDVLNGNKIVCVGYANLLQELCNRVGINCSIYELRSTEPDTPGHAACCVYLEDPKYGIKGTFYSDPTWCSPKQKIDKGQSISMSFMVEGYATKLYQEEGLEFKPARAKSRLLETIGGKAVAEEMPFYMLQKSKLESLEGMSSEIETHMDEIKSKIRQEIEDIYNSRSNNDITSNDKSKRGATLDKLLHGILETFEWNIYSEDSTLVNDLYVETLINMKMKKEQIIDAVFEGLDKFVKSSLSKKSKEFYGKDVTDFSRYEGMNFEQLEEMYTEILNRRASVPNGKVAISHALRSVGFAQGKDKAGAFAYSLSRLNGYSPEMQATLEEAFRDAYELGLTDNKEVGDYVMEQTAKKKTEMTQESESNRESIEGIKKEEQAKESPVPESEENTEMTKKEDDNETEL